MISELQGENYINLETYKKNGQPIRTPVAFVQDNAVIYVRTDKNSGKLKRLRNNPHVRIVPCDIRGNNFGLRSMYKVTSQHNTSYAIDIALTEFAINAKLSTLN